MVSISDHLFDFGFKCFLCRKSQKLNIIQLFTQSSFNNNLYYSMEIKTQNDHVQPLQPTSPQNPSQTKRSNLLTPIESYVLELNKLGMEHLARQQIKQAAQNLKKAEAIITQQVAEAAQKDQGLNRLFGITLNNLGCYYKKTNKPKVALQYLKEALEIQVYNVEDWISTAGTHLNICAIFSFLNKHKEAADHANLSIRLLERQNQRNKQQNNASLNNVLIVSYYNLGVELQHLRQYYDSKQAYEKGLQLTKQNNKLQNMNMSKIMEESIERLTKLLNEKEKKQYNNQEKKREQEIAGHYDYMRKHKRKSLARDNVLLGTKKFPSYTKSNYRSGSIGEMASPKSVNEKDRSPVGIKNSDKQLKGRRDMRL